MNRTMRPASLLRWTAIAMHSARCFAAFVGGGLQGVLSTRMT